jgi:hypothetical protein
MKNLISLLVLLSIHNYSFSQLQDMSYREHGEYLDVYDNAGNKLPMNDHPLVLNNLMLNQQWATGSVVFNNGQQVSNLPLQFDVAKNALHFKKDSVVYAFAAVVRACKMTYADGNQKKEVLLRSGYPDHNGDSSDVLYMVINEGPNVHFLKWLKPTIYEHYDYGTAPKEIYGIAEESYLYNVNKHQLVKISANEKSILKALPEYKEQIQKFERDNNSKLDNDNDISKLISMLNVVQ